MNRRITAPAALKTVEEVREWFEYHLLKEDGSESQEAALGLQDLIPPLTTFGPSKRLSHTDAQAVREQCRKTILPGLRYLLESFGPYREYIQKIRALESKALVESDLAQHAFMKLRFGTCRASEELLKDVNDKYDELVERLGDLKGSLFDELLALDIGMRGVMSAFGYGKGYFDDDKARTTPWEEYAEWFVAGLDRVYADGWFCSFMKLDAKRRGYLTHVTYDAGGGIVNYKHAHQEKGFGALLAILVFKEGKDALSGSTFEDVWEDCSEALKTPLKGGYRKQIRAQLIAEDFKGTQAEFKSEVQRKTDLAVTRHIKGLAKHLGIQP